MAPSGAPDVFVSYDRRDDSLAEAVASGLIVEGYAVFRDTAIPVGEAWDEAIELALGGSAAVIVLWSEFSCESKWVRREARHAAARSVLCPVVMRPCKIPIEFSDVQAADLTAWIPGNRQDQQWRRLLSRVGRLARRAPDDDASEADVASTTAQLYFEIAMMHLSGDGAPCDPSVARTLLERAAAGSVPMAALELARLYRTGTGGEQDHGRARELCHTVASQSIDPEAARVARQYLDEWR